MHKSIIALVATVTMMGGMSLMSSPQAAPATPNLTLDRFSIIEPARMWGGQSYCWYDDGWNGAGWYQCGYAKRRGYGWGGPYGWHGWGMHHMGMGRWGHHMGGCCW
jgi:hypothetical protein